MASILFPNLIFREKPRGNLVNTNFVTNVLLHLSFRVFHVPIHAFSNDFVIIRAGAHCFYSPGKHLWAQYCISSKQNLWGLEGVIFCTQVCGYFHFSPHKHWNLHTTMCWWKSRATKFRGQKKEYVLPNILWAWMSTAHSNPLGKEEVLVTLWHQGICYVWC